MDSGSVVKRKKNKRVKSDASSGIMDSEGVVTRSKRRILEKCKSDNVENTQESAEESVPPILSREIYDVFHIFVSMLDMKSFINLTMTSKAMKKQCLENKSIKINIDADYMFFSVHKSTEYSDSYLDAIQKFSCNVNVNHLQFHDSQEPENLMISNFRSYLKKMKVKKINTLRISNLQNSTDWEALIAIIKEFGVKTMEFDCEIETDRLHSILQLNLEGLCYENKAVPLDFLLEVQTSIQTLDFPKLHVVSKEKFMTILSRIQSGSFHRLILRCGAVNWNEFNALPFDHEEPLPEDRPLLLARTSKYGCSREYWFVHWHGGVSKCVVNENLEIFKCEPWEYPWILRKEEDILKDLAEKRPRVSCSASQFHTFSSGFIIIDRSHKGPLPESRPLYCKVDKNHFWLLEENDNLMKCTWEDGSATWKTLTWEKWHSRNYITIDIKHPALAKYMFWKVLEQIEIRKNDWADFKCEDVKEFNSWFMGFNMLKSQYSDALPSERPLIFEDRGSRYSRHRFVLLKERLLDCHFSRTQVVIRHCHYLNRPPALFTGGNVAEMLKDPNNSDLNLTMSLDVFVEGLNQFKNSTLVLQNCVHISETSPTEFWYRMDNYIRKVVWEGGSLIRTKMDLNDCPPDFMKQVFRNLAEFRCDRCTLELKQLHSCLEQFNIVPFDYSGPLKNDPPMAFVNKKIHHRCRKGPNRVTCCKCGESSIRVWFLWEGMRTTTCSWVNKIPNIVFFGGSDCDLKDVPPFLKSKEYLQTILKAKYDKSSRFKWFGSFGDLMACLNDYMKLPFDFDDPLPEKRPIYFDNGEDDEDRVYLLLREDETVIKCRKYWDAFEVPSITFSLSSTHEDNVPPALMNLL